MKGKFNCKTYNKIKGILTSICIIIIIVIYGIIFKSMLVNGGDSHVSLVNKIEYEQLKNNIEEDKITLKMLVENKFLQNETNSLSERVGYIKYNKFFSSNVELYGIANIDGVVKSSNEKEYYIKNQCFYTYALNNNKVITCIDGNFFTGVDEVVTAIPIKKNEQVTGILLAVRKLSDVVNLYNDVEFFGKASVSIIDINGNILNDNGNLDGYLASNIYDELKSYNKNKTINAFKRIVNQGLQSNIQMKINNENRIFAVSKTIEDKFHIVTSIPYRTVIEENRFILFINTILVTILIGLVLFLNFIISRNKSKMNTIEERNNIKKEFISNIGHELRTPMNAIIGMSENALYEIENRESVKYSLEIINNSSKYLLSVLNDILTMSKLEKSKLEINETSFNLVDLCEDINAIIKNDLEKKNQSFKLDISKNIECNIKADKLKVQQVLVNLLTNASKYTKEKGSIEFFIDCIEKRKDIQNVVFIIKDNGIGMSKKFMEKLYEPFTREKNIENKNYNGVGLGLSISRKIIKEMGGEIEVISNINIGTIFKVYLSFKVDKEKKVEDENLINKNNILNGKKILLVEDNEINMMIISSIVERLGINVVKAKTGKEGIEKFELSYEDKFDAILMDINMPIMDGDKASKIIKTKFGHYGKNIAIISMSAGSICDEAEEYINPWIDYSISKPINRDEVIKVLTKIFSKV